MSRSCDNLDSRRRIVRAALTTLVALSVVSACLVGIRYWPRATLAEQIPSSTAIFDRKGRLLRLTLARDQQYRLWTPLEDVAPEFVDALLLHEDRYFYRHPGFNAGALARAAFSTYTGGPRVGGSTITMQLARLMYDLNTRTVSGKLQQIARAVQLELCYSKREILEAHINLMPYGGNIQGIGAASLIYFDKSAARLGLAESLALVLIPQSPLRRTPDRLEPSELRAARLRLFDRWAEERPQARSSSRRAARTYASPRYIWKSDWKDPNPMVSVALSACSSNGMPSATRPESA